MQETPQKNLRVFFGTAAPVYDDVRPGYPVELVDAVLEYVGDPPDRILEIGAGTGKATEAFARIGAPIVCLEPDPQMAALLVARFADRPQVTVEVTRFENWSAPQDGIPLVYSAQAWHWLDPEVRCRRAHEVLRPHGVLALLAHQYDLADPAVAAAVRETYVRTARLLDQRADRAATPEKYWFAVELAGSPFFVDVTARHAVSIVEYSTARFLGLIGTFRRQRMLDEPTRSALFAAIAELIESQGGSVGVRLDTVVALGRRAA